MSRTLVFRFSEDRSRQLELINYELETELIFQSLKCLRNLRHFSIQYISTQRYIFRNIQTCRYISKYCAAYFLLLTHLEKFYLIDIYMYIQKLYYREMVCKNCILQIIEKKKPSRICFESLVHMQKLKKKRATYKLLFWKTILKSAIEIALFKCSNMQCDI